MEKNEKIAIIKKMAIEVLQEATEPLRTSEIYEKIRTKAANETGLKENSVWDPLNNSLKEDTQTFFHYESSKIKGKRDFWLRSRGSYKGAVEISPASPTNPKSPTGGAKNPPKSNTEIEKNIQDFRQKLFRNDENLKHSNEAQIINSVIVPFLKILGYLVKTIDADDGNLIAEVIADYKDKKGEKLDLALYDKNDKPLIAIECKKYEANLEATDYLKQLNGYFDALNDDGCRLAILTNGVEYRFFSDLDKENKMDKEPFFVFNLRDFDAEDVAMLDKFVYHKINVKKIREIGTQMKEYSRVLDRLKHEAQSPSDEFIKIFAKNEKGNIKSYKEKYKKYIKKAFVEIKNDALKIQAV